MYPPDKPVRIYIPLASLATEKKVPDTIVGANVGVLGAIEGVEEVGAIDGNAVVGAIVGPEGRKVGDEVGGEQADALHVAPELHEKYRVDPDDAAT